MPRFVCDDCGDVFDSKADLSAHREDCDVERTSAQVASSIRGVIDGVRSLTLRQVFVLFGIVLMGTLFAGTAFYYSTISPTSGPSGGGDGVSQETTPPVGYTIRSGADVPDVRQGDLPEGTVVDRELSHDVQLSLLTGSVTGNGAVLLQYSCEDCPETRDALASIAGRFNGGTSWVFVAPYRDMDERVAATAFQRKQSFDAVNETQIETFICTSLRNEPVECAIS